MNTKIATFALLATLASGSLVHAQPRERRSAGVTVTWTAIGAGAGFGVGLWAGLTAFDDAINSDRKVWTSAIIGAGVGALGGFLIGRAIGTRDGSAKSNPANPSLGISAMRPVVLQ